jgi:uncharacterized membrane-anchored protein
MAAILFLYWVYLQCNFYCNLAFQVNVPSANFVLVMIGLNTLAYRLYPDFLNRWKVPISISCRWERRWVKPYYWRQNLFHHQDWTLHSDRANSLYIVVLSMLARILIVMINSFFLPISVDCLLPFSPLGYHIL